MNSIDQARRAGPPGPPGSPWPPSGARPAGFGPPGALAARAAASSERNRRRLVSLVWLYFALLILEGVLRKWVFPEWSDALLIVRDPVAAFILYLGLRDGYVPMGGLMRRLRWVPLAFVLLATVQLTVYHVPAATLLFGLRTFFLHPPVIFVMARVLDGRDLRRFVMAMVVVAVPIAFLMVAQFRASPEDWINRGAGVGSSQLLSALHRVRPAGPFSFITGPVCYFSLLMACLITVHLNRLRISPLVEGYGWVALLVATSVSGSRALAFGLVPVLLAAVVVLARRPVLTGTILRSVVIGATVVMTVWGSSAINEGLAVFDARMQQSGGVHNLVGRSTDAYTQAVSAFIETPAWGLGLGLGTNAGSALADRPAFALGEGEWSRVLYEAGSILGAAYLAWRVWLCTWLFRLSLRAAATGAVLPMTVFGAVLSNLLLGQWGQPTTQGFAVLGAGVCLAACHVAGVDRVRRPRPAPAWAGPLRQSSPPARVKQSNDDAHI